MTAFESDGAEPGVAAGEGAAGGRAARVQVAEPPYQGDFA
jgi:hypothetical protein